MYMYNYIRNMQFIGECMGIVLNTCEVPINTAFSEWPYNFSVNLGFSLKTVSNERRPRLYIPEQLGEW